MTVRTRIDSAGLIATVVHDPLPADGSALPAAIVPGPGGATLTLLQLLPHDHISRAWDLGCGSGAVAAIVAQFADQVVATDIDPRCLALTQQTAAESGVEVETRLGSLAEPVADEQFDLIVSNPPFVIGNATQLVHRESPFDADGLTGELLELLPRRLAPGGIAIMLTAWLETATEPWAERIGNWLPIDCDSWVGLRELLPIDEYVRVWLADAGQAADQATGELWLQRLQNWRATGVAFGWVVLRKSAPPGISRIEDLRNAERLPNGAEVLARLADARAAEQLTAVAALSADFRPTARQPWRGDIGLDPLLAALRAGLADQPLAAVADQLAAQWQLDPDDVRIHALAGSRTLVDLGLVAQV